MRNAWKFILTSAAVTLFIGFSGGPAHATAPLYSIDTFTASAVSSTQIYLVWSYVNAALVDPAITGYMIERESPVGGGFTTIAISAQGTSYTDTNLSANTAYNYRISAINADGASATRTISATTLFSQAQLSPPDPPQNVTAAAASGSAINISWMAAPNSPVVTGYEIERGMGGSGFTVIVSSTGSTATNYTDTNLSPGAAYGYRITALSSYGASNPSAAALAITMTLPGEPQSAAAVAGNAQATVSWTPPLFTGGSVTGYIITWSPNGSSSVGNVLTTVVTGLTNGNSYSFGVSTVNPVGQSSAVATNIVVPSATVATTTATTYIAVTPAPQPPPAPSSVEPDRQALQNQLNALIALLQQLQAQVNAQTSAQTGSSSNTVANSETNSQPSAQSGFARNLSIGSSGDDVVALQQFLIDQNKGARAQNLAEAGASGRFGLLTKEALIEFQVSVDISPASGYFGPKTRGYINSAQ